MKKLEKKIDVKKDQVPFDFLIPLVDKPSRKKNKEQFSRETAALILGRNKE